MNFKKLISKAFFVTIVALAWSCDEEHPLKQSSGDYFPLEDSKKWSYERWLSMSISPDVILDTMHLRVDGDITVDGKSYKQILDHNGDVDKIIRVEGSMYFGRDHELYSGYSHEYMFLDSEKPEGYSWFYIKDEGMSKTEYVISAKNTEHTILGKTYTDVIEVQVNYYDMYGTDELTYRSSVIHHYAKGVGEIFNFYPYPVSLYYGDVSSFIIQ